MKINILKWRSMSPDERVFMLLKHVIKTTKRGVN